MGRQPQAFQRAEIGVRVEHIGAHPWLGYGVHRVSEADPAGTPCARVAITYVCGSGPHDRAKHPVPSGLRAALEAGSS